MASGVRAACARNRSSAVSAPHGTRGPAAQRESTASRGIKLPVTLLAKWKTTIQLVAVGGELLVGTWAPWPLPSEPTVLEPVTLLVHALLWIAAAITLWTGAEYWHKAHVAVGDD